MKTKYILLVLGVGLLACKPDLQPLGNGTTAPVACHIMGELDGQSLRFEAGIQQLFMHTDLQLNDQQLFETSAAIKPDPCEGCGNYLEVTIRDFQRNDGSQLMNPDSTFQIKTYPFQLGGSGSFLRQITLRQSNLDGLSPTANQWSVFSAASSLIAQSSNLQATFTLPLGNYTTQLISSFSNGCRDTSTQTIAVDGLTGPCSAEMQVSRIPNSTLMQFDTLNVQVPNPMVVTWKIGGLTLTGGSVFLITDSFLLPAVFEVELEVFSASCTVKVVQRVAKNPISSCATSFKVANIQLVDPLLAGHVRVKWTDSQGIVYASELDQQPNWSNFVVTAIDTFPKDRAGFASVLVSGSLNSRLFTPNSTLYKDLRKAEFKMAFPYKP